MLHIRHSDFTSRCHLQNHIAVVFNFGDCNVSHEQLLLNLAFLISVEHRPISANVGGYSCVIPPFLGVSSFNHVHLSHHCNVILLSEIRLMLLISDLAATLSSLVSHFMAVVTLPLELLYVRIDFNAFVLEVFFRSFQDCISFLGFGRRMGVCLSFAFVLSHVDTMLLRVTLSAVHFWIPSEASL